MAIFEETKKETEPQYSLDEFVGEGRKYKTVDDFVKSFVHKQKHIETLETGYAELQADLETRVTAEELFKQLRAQTTEEQNQQQNTPVEATETQREVTKGEQSTLTPDDVKKILAEERQNEVRSNNLESFTNRVLEVFGDEGKALEGLKTKAAELNLTLQDLEQMAAKSPKVALKILDLEAKPTANTSKVTSYTPPNQRQVNTADPKTPEDWRALRKENPVLYFSPKMVQKRVEFAQKNFESTGKTGF